MGPLSRMVGEAVNFTREYRADQKERKEARETNEESAQEGNRQNAGQHAAPADDSDSEDWAVGLDEIQQQEGISPGPQQGDQQVDGEERMQLFLERHPPPSYEQSSASPRSGGLPMPVILPQRRPEARHRGFVRAYAPVLGECGIDQATWLEFLDGFEKSIKNNPWFGVLNAGVMIADTTHTAVGGYSPFIMLTTLAIQVGLETSRRTYLNYKQNGYLDTMNEQFFKPRGLFCLMVKYKPSSSELVEKVDLNGNITKAVENRDGQSKWKNAMRTTTTAARDEAEIPEPAPLIFPDLDALDEGEKQNAVKQFGRFVTKYYDRRAAAQFQARSPDSKIPQAPVPESMVQTARSPPPGGLVSMATGGKVVGPIGRMQQRRNQRFEERGSTRRVGPAARQERKRNKPLNKLMRQDALYLMVVNLPTQEEMDAVLARVEAS